jgi:hypothetical protein
LGDAWRNFVSADSVRVDQTGKQARIVVIKKGDPTETTPFLQQVLKTANS